MEILFILTAYWGPDQIKRRYSEFEASVQKAKQYLENIAKAHMPMPSDYPKNSFILFSYSSVIFISQWPGKTL
jgi:hypothetical protein